MSTTRLGESYRGPDGRIGYLLRQAYQAMRSEIDRVAREHGTTAPQFSILGVLKQEPGVTGAELAQQSMLRPQTTNEIVVALQRKGLVDRRPDPADKRIRRLYLTAEGARVLAKVSRRVLEVEERALAELGTTERRALATWLVNVAFAFDRHDARVE